MTLRQCLMRVSASVWAPERDQVRIGPGFPLGWHYLGVCALAFFVGLIFLQAPGFGDELNYWSLAFNLHERGGDAWDVKSYHDLRWPIWGPSWLWQSVFGPGLSSFYVVPFVYLAAAAALAFAFGRRVFGSLTAAWICAVALLFEPLIDGVIVRGMPDLAESVFGGGALLAWWGMMRAQRRAAIVVQGALAGVFIGLGYSNRPSGLFIVAVVLLATLTLYPRNWLRLAIPALGAIGFFLAECALYQAVCGDWWHSLHANMRNKAAKGTEPQPWWQYPGRYLPAFTHGNRLAWVFSAAAVLGIMPLWKRRCTGSKLVLIWFAVLFLILSCAIQSVHPLRPLVGSAVRYLSMLAIPMALMIGAGVTHLLSCGRGWRWERAQGLLRWCQEHRLPVGAAATLLLLLGTSRPLFDLDYIPAVRAYLAAQQAGTRVFTHREMRDLVFLVAPEQAALLTWATPSRLMAGGDALEKQAAECSQWWYLRKHLWMGARRGLETGRASGPQPPLPSYLNAPEGEWVLTQALAQDEEPELVFYRKRQPGDPPARVLDSHGGLLGTSSVLPWEWKAPAHRSIALPRWHIPREMCGQVVHIQATGDSDAVEPFDIKLRFLNKAEKGPVYRFKPIFYPGGGKEFLVLRFPADAETCELSLYMARRTRRLTISSLRMVYDYQR
jgi:hypothetical protein